MVITSDNDESYIPEISAVKNSEEYGADETIIQMQIPYSATLTLPGRLSAVELAPLYRLPRRAKPLLLRISQRRKSSERSSR